jgi:glycosyltransferase involved in cell wall biosynthesis
MKISVVIPAYNCAATIKATLDSALAQTRSAAEILVIDDGSTDETLSSLRAYGSRITLLQHSNSGPSISRNVLIARATGDLIAFLDADDLWHPSYLECQAQLYERYPNAVALFSDHVDVYGNGPCTWPSSVAPAESTAEVISPLEFLRRIHKSTCLFLPSFWCVPRLVLQEIALRDGAVFVDGIKGAEDGHLLHRLLLLGSVVFSPLKIGAYRILPSSLSADRLAITGRSVRAMEMLADRYSNLPDRRLSKEFKRAFASKRREYSKVLFGSANTNDGRTQLWLSLANSLNLESWTKSLLLIALSVLPQSLQPSWPCAQRR